MCLTPDEERIALLTEDNIVYCTICKENKANPKIKCRLCEKRNYCSDQCKSYDLIVMWHWLICDYTCVEVIDM